MRGLSPSDLPECAGSVPNVVNGKFATLSLITNRIVNRGYFVSYNFDLREYLLRRAVGDDAPVVDLDDARGGVGGPRKLGTDPERYYIKFFSSHHFQNQKDPLSVLNSELPNIRSCPHRRGVFRPTLATPSSCGLWNLVISAINRQVQYM